MTGVNKDNGSNNDIDVCIIGIKNHFKVCTLYIVYIYIYIIVHSVQIDLLTK